MASRQDYEAFAKILKTARDGGHTHTDAAIDDIMFRVADYFADDNGRFDRERFYEASTLRKEHGTLGGLIEGTKIY